MSNDVGTRVLEAAEQAELIKDQSNDALAGKGVRRNAGKGANDVVPDLHR
jgi:hypothetical protein